MAETMRGMRLGSQSLESDAGVELSERQRAGFRCPSGHEFSMVFAANVEMPETWDCRSCSQKAVRLDGVDLIIQSMVNEDAPRSHYDMVLERRSREELEELLAEMLADMRSRRAAGRLSA